MGQALTSDMQTVPRQDPVSCESCRKRKQKCSRQQPCSNCTNRGVHCIFLGRKVPVATTSSASIPSDFQSLRAENAAIKARLDTLEDIILNGGSQPDSSDIARPQKVRRVTQADVTVPTPSSTTSGHSNLERLKNYKNDMEWLDGVGSRENTRLPQLSTGFNIRIGSVDQIFQHISSDRDERCILIPHKNQIAQLFQAYVEQVDPMQHVLHIPTVRRAIDRLYARIEIGDRVEPNQTVLLLSILASIASYWSPADAESPSGIFNSAQNAFQAGNHWLKMTLDVLEHVKRTTSATLETIQSCLLMIFLIYHMEGFSPKVRAILAAALSAAKDLGLHQTDRHGNSPPSESREDLVDKEMRRRVWWHLACTDWSLGVAGGPHEGSYNVNPNHMKVKRPRNVSDEELETMSADFEHGLSEPTIMSYYLQRIRLSELSRHVTDLTCDTVADDIAVQDVVDVDCSFQKILAELPSFLRVDEENRQLNCSLDKTHRHIILQRYTVNLALHARRCKFHLPLLLRASHDPHYTFSRKACLESARAVMKLKVDLTIEHGSLWLSSSKLGGFLHLYFYATVVLVMDICVNGGVGEEGAKKKEIREALETLEQAKQQSVAAGMFVDSLMAALRKHSIRLQGQHQEDSERGLIAFATPQANTVPQVNNYSSNSITPSVDDQSFTDIDFDALWQNFIEPGFNIDPHSWDPLISDLESCVQGISED